MKPWRPALAPADGLVLLVAAATGTWVAILLWRRIEGLASAAYDLGFFQQLVWNLAAGEAWTSSFHSGSFLGLHFSPLLAVPAAIQAVVGFDPRVLSLIHAVAVAGLVPATYGFLRAAWRPSRWATPLAIGLAIALPLWTTTQWIIRADFHPEVVGVALALGAGWAGLTGRRGAMWALAVLACLTREDVAYAVAVVALVVAVRGPTRDDRRHGRLLVVLAVAWALVVFGALMPWFRDGMPSDTARYYRWLAEGGGILGAPFRETDRIVGALTRSAPWTVVAGMLVAVVGLPIWRPAWLLLLVPPLAALLLSAHPPQAAIILHYPIVLLAPLLAATAMGGRRALAVVGVARRRLRATGRRRARAFRAPRGTAALLSGALAALVAALVAAPGAVMGTRDAMLPPFDWRDVPFAQRGPALRELGLVAAAVPPGAPLVADEGLVAPLAARPDIRRLTGGGRPERDAFVLIDRDAWSPSRASEEQRDRMIGWLTATSRPIVVSDGRFVLWGPAVTGTTP